MDRKRGFVLPLALATGLVLASCGSSSSSKPTAGSSSSAKSAPVSVRLFGDWPTLNPYATNGNINSIIVDTGIYDRLVALSEDGKTAVPYLATKWTATPTELVFTIRPGVTCSDGTPLGPAEVAKSLQFLSTQSENKLLLGPGPYTITNDDSTVTIKLGSPFSDALLDFTSPHASIICPAEIPLIQAGNSLQAVGSGPYTITQAVHGDHMTMAPRSEWTWGPNGESAKKPGFPSEVTLRVVGNDTTAANEILTGQLDVGSVTGPDVNRLKAKKSLLYSQYGGSYLSELVFNPKVDVLQDVKVREAISRAIDTKAFMQADTGGFGVTSPSMLAPGAQCYDANVAKLVPSPSVSEAQKILQADGYTLSNGQIMKDGKQLTLRLLSTTANFSTAATEYLAATLGKVGIATPVTNVNAAAYGPALTGGNFDIGVGFLSGGGPAPGNYILYMTGPSFAHGGGNSGLDDPEVDALVTAAFAASGSAQCPAWAKVQEKVIQNHDTVPLDQQTKQYFSNGVQMTPLTAITLDSLHR
jgi:peptide/nickel transport system substrate-binding protein